MENGMFLANRSKRNRGDFGPINYGVNHPSLSRNRGDRAPLIGSPQYTYRDGFRDGYRDGLFRGDNFQPEVRDHPAKRGFDSYWNDSKFRGRPGIMPSQQPFRGTQQRGPPQQYGGYHEDYAFYDDYMRGRNVVGNSGNWYEPAPSFRFDGPDFGGNCMPPPPMAPDLNFKQRGMVRDESVVGYLGIHNMKKGKSGLFLINYINFLLRSRLLYNGPPIVFSSRLNENTLEAVFPNIDVLRNVVEKLSPIMVKGNITVYVTYKPAQSNNPATTSVGGLGHRRIQRTFTPSSRKNVPQQSLRALNNNANASKTRKKNKTRAPRLRGVFPDGVQPTKVLLVVDQQSPFISIEELREKETELLLGKDLDVSDFLKLIHSDSSLQEDNTLFVIVPSFAFLLKSLSAFGSLEPEEEACSAISTKPPQKRKKGLLHSILSEFSSQLRSVDVEYLGKLPPFTQQKSNEEEVNSNSVELLARHLIYSAMYLRASVRTNSENCEVVFCGFPLHHLCQTRIEGHLAPKMGKIKAAELGSSIIGAIRVFNKFATNSWQLGGFKIANFSDDKALITLMSNLKIEDDEAETDKKTAKDSVVASTNGLNGELQGSETLDLTDMMGDKLNVFPLKNLAKLTLLKEGLELAQVKSQYTNNVLVAVQRVNNFQKNKGEFVPWTAIEAEAFDPSEMMPDIVKESVLNDIYVEHKTKEKTVYECNGCRITVGDVVAADQHAYTRRHFNHVRRVVQQKAKSGGAKKSLLIGTANAAKVVPLSEQFKAKLLAFKLITLAPSTSTSSSGTNTRYQCAACESTRTNTFDEANLRFHVHHYRHRMSVNTFFGLNTHRSLVSQHENWSLVQSLLRHPPCDVILLADDRHEYTLKSITAECDKARLFTYPSLLESPAIWPNFISLGLGATEQRPALWLLIAGADMIEAKVISGEKEEAEQLMQPLIALQTFLRSHLPVSHHVVTTPLMPLYLVSNNLSTQVTSRLYNSTNSLIIPSLKTSGLFILYTALHKSSIALHKATATHSNINSLSSLQCPPVSVVTDGASEPFLTMNPWHFAVRSLVLSALHGMPSVFLRPHLEQLPNLEELELDSRISHVTVVAPDVKLKKGNRFESEKNLILQRNLKFSEDDVDFIASKAVACEEGNYTAWYLSCPFPDILFDSAEFHLGNAQKDDKPLLKWTLKKKSVDETLLELSRFLLVLQSKMPAGNFVTLMPIFPALIMPNADASVISSMKHLSNNVIFSDDDQRSVVAVLDKFKEGWSEIFLKTNLHYTMRFDRSLLTPVQILDAAAALTVKDDYVARVQTWLSTFNSLLRNFSSRLNAVFADEIMKLLPEKTEQAAPVEKAPEKEGPVNGS